MHNHGSDFYITSIVFTNSVPTTGFKCPSNLSQINYEQVKRIDITCSSRLTVEQTRS